VAAGRNCGHVIWLGLGYWLVIVLLRDPTSDLSGWRRGIVWFGGALAIAAGCIFAYAAIMIEFGTRVLGRRH
jgi:hypothetical protein